MRSEMDLALASIWRGMRQRCCNPNLKEFKYYGGKGITVCDRWQVFFWFREDMGPGYFAGASIDRINNSKNYEPENCRWILKGEQARNRECNKMNFELAEALRLDASQRFPRIPQSELAKKYGVNERTVRRVIKQECWPSLQAQIASGMI